MSFAVFNEDCLEGMKRLADGAIDFILTDLPYNLTACKWDKSPIDLAEMWQQFRRVLKPCCSAALFASGKFTYKLVASNFEQFKYKWFWRKNSPVNFLNAKRMPLRVHEDILIFYAALPTYNPQFTQGKPYKKERPATSRLYVPNGGKGFDERGSLNVDGRRYPIDVQQFKQPQGAHPAQKPTALLEYLIRTYTNEGETVLDATMGSGSTGVACMKTGRNFIGFELEEKFYDIALKRINDAENLKLQELF